jgi:hypothetical protein
LVFPAWFNDRFVPTIILAIQLNEAGGPLMKRIVLAIITILLAAPALAETWYLMAPDPQACRTRWCSIAWGTGWSRHPCN